MTPKQVDKAIKSRIKDLHFLIEKNFWDIADTLESKKQKRQFKEFRDAIRDAYWKSIAMQLEDNNSMVKDLLKDLEKLNKDVKSRISNLKNIADFLNKLSDGMKLVGSLLSFATIA